MGVHEKLVQARLDFQRRGVKMSGKNDFAGYAYYELSDILPAINEIAADLKFACLVSFTHELATLVFIDTESAENITFTSPMSEASLKGCHAVQNLGAVETYIKRYLYQHVFEIVETDILNKTHNPNDKPTNRERAPEKSGHPTAQEQCAELSKELEIQPEGKAQMWKDSGQNFSNLLVMLKSLKDERDKVISGISGRLDKAGV